MPEREIVYCDECGFIRKRFHACPRCPTCNETMKRGVAHDCAGENPEAEQEEEREDVPHPEGHHPRSREGSVASTLSSEASSIQPRQVRTPFKARKDPTHLGTVYINPQKVMKQF